MSGRLRALRSGDLPAPGRRFSIERRLGSAAAGDLADDVREGLCRARKALPSKYFYDARGSELFDRICELPEYYLTRAEHALLERHARSVLATARPTDLIELGSGSARKTRTLLGAGEAEGLELRYRPFDVCEPMLRASGDALLERYRWLEVHAIVGDYDRDLEPLPEGPRRLVAFLGSTIGNYTPRESAEFLARIARALRQGDFLLLGADLVKPIERLEAAYDDDAGITAEFNRNVLRVVNRELDANFDPEAYDHVAFFDRNRSQMEMHLRAATPQRVVIRKLDMTVEIAAGETIHTEISRKFTETELRELSAECGFTVRSWLLPEDGAFALLLAERR
jgi:L-histidine N-alpha-methyltransferase